MPKLVTVTFLSLVTISIPWLAFALWENLPQSLGISSKQIHYVFISILGLMIGVVIVKKEIKLTIIPIPILLFTFSTIVWNTNRFNSHKRDLETNAIEYPLHLSECEKESNFENFWDYIQNGCHFTVDDFVGSLLNKVLILTLAILLSKTLLEIVQTKRKKRKDPRVIDQRD